MQGTTLSLGYHSVPRERRMIAHPNYGRYEFVSVHIGNGAEAPVWVEGLVP
jgi:hypothetical protein